jgi:hypothetical protein
MDIITLLVSFLAAHLPTLLSALSQNTKWLRHFVFLKPLQGLVFNSQKCDNASVNWYYI